MPGGESEVVVIEEWTQAPKPGRRRSNSKWLSSHAVGILATLSFHFLVTAPLLFGGSAREAPPREPMAPGSATWAAERSTNQAMILLDLSAISAEERVDQEALEIKTAGIEIDDIKLALASPDIRPPPEIVEAQEPESAEQISGDPAAAAAFFGRYIVQVAARIERNWSRPRTPVEAGRFNCSARIARDPRGNVMSIDLLDCSSDALWRESLISAIKRASPLSAPSEPWLSAKTVVLKFSAEQYQAGHTPEYLYERRTTKLAQAVTQPSDNPMPVGGGDLDLTIEGNRAKWSRKDGSPKISDER